MQKSSGAKCQASFFTATEQAAKVNPVSDHNVMGRPFTQGRRQRSAGVWKSGLLLVGFLTLAVLATPTASSAASISVGISVGIAPPALPVYTQPVCPAPGYIWTPGYWAYDPVEGYFWVPGTWVMAPTAGFLWTPGYWGWGGAAFFWHEGYWGPHVGFYGGVNYGFGYPGVGFVGGEWRGGNFFYNRSVNNFGGGHFTNVYYRQVTNNYTGNRASYNGGTGGITARPNPGEQAAENDRHIGATSVQQSHESASRGMHSQFASVNHGRPDVAATGKPGEFNGSSVVHATHAGGEVNANAGGFHSTNPGANSPYGSAHSTNPGANSPYGGTHRPNPGGGGTNQVMTAHSNVPANHSSSTSPGEKSNSGFHPTTPPHNESPRGAPANHTVEPHAQPSTSHNSKPPSGGGEKHEPEPHH
jgi:hypothetical protein